MTINDDILNWVQNNPAAIRDVLRQLQQTEQVAAQDSQNTLIAETKQWYENTILPQLRWNDSQTLTQQRQNILDDLELVKSLIPNETNRMHRGILIQKCSIPDGFFNQKFKEIKKALNLQVK